MKDESVIGRVTSVTSVTCNNNVTRNNNVNGRVTSGFALVSVGAGFKPARTINV